MAPDKRENTQESIPEIIKKEWNTIPNFFSYFRILLIPVFVILYVKTKYIAAAVVIAVSLASDIADGFIARNFNMVSRLGKVLDPLADKLTQVAIFVCISMRYRLALLIVAVIVAKELTIFVMGLVVFKRSGEVDGARWYGKMATGIIVVSSFLMVLFPMMEESLAYGLIWLSIAAAAFSYLMYVLRYIGILKDTK